MAADSKHLYLVARGDYTDSLLVNEKWQCGVRLFADTSVPDNSGDLPVTGDFSADSVSSTPTGLHVSSEWKWFVGLGSVVVPSDYLTNQAAPAWSTFMAGGTISSGVRLKELRLYPILGDGHAFEGRVAIASYDTPPTGGRTGTIMPLETSLVCSTRTFRPGPRGRGRMYLPPSTSTAINSIGNVSSTLIAALAPAFATFLQTLSVNPVSPTATHVRPIVTGAPWDKYAAITSIDVGDVWDAQRRRRRSLGETRTSHTVTY